MTREVSLHASCVRYCSSSSEWSRVHMQAGVRASLLVSFCLIPQVNTSTYLRPCTLLLAFLLSCRACPHSLVFVWLGRGKKWTSKETKAWCNDWRKDKGGARTHTVTTWHIHQGALKTTGLWPLAMELFSSLPPCQWGQAALFFTCFLSERDRDWESERIYWLTFLILPLGSEHRIQLG